MLELEELWLLTPDQLTHVLEPGYRAVERSWAETPPGHHVSMLLDRVAVLRPFSQADENKQAPGPIDILRVA